MARPAESPPPLVGAIAPAEPRRPDLARRPPRKRLVAASLAIFVGIALVAVGIVQTTGGLAGIDLAGSSRASANAQASGGPPSSASSPVEAAGSTGSGASSGPIAGPGSPAPSSPPPGVVPSNPTPTEQLDARLQATLDRARTKLAIPGASVTILDRKSVV